jgi:hypothetical protein
MKYDVIILAHEREESLQRCAGFVLHQDPAPTNVFVWHNGCQTTAVEGAINIFSDHNFGCPARHALVNLLSSPGVVFIDDDVYVYRRSLLQELADVAFDYSGQLVGPSGADIGWATDQPYTQREEIRQAVAEADVMKGLLHVATVDAVIGANYFKFDVPQSVLLEDDIMLSAAMTMAYHKRHRVVELGPRDIEYAMWPGSLQERPDHYERRDAACLAMMQRGWEPRNGRC